MRNHSILPMRFGWAIVFLVAALCSAPIASAGTSVWGGAGADFNAAENWVSGGEPTLNVAEFYDGTPAHLTDIYLSADISVAQLKMLSGKESVTIVSGNKLTLQDYLGNDGILTETGFENILTVNCNLGLYQSQTTQVQINGGGVVIGGSISGAANSYLKKTGIGALTLNGANTFGALGQGGVTLDGGLLNIGNVAALSVGTFTVRSGSTWDNTMGSAQTLSTNNNMTFYDSTATYTFAGTNSLNMGTGSVYFGGGNSTGAITMAVNANELTFGGDIEIKSGHSFKKQGDGTLTLNGANTGNSGFTLDGGRLNIGNAAALGTGTFTVRGGSTWDNTMGSAQTLSANNNMTFYDANGIYTFAGTNSLNMGTGEANFTGGGSTGSPTIVVNANELTFDGPVVVRSDYNLKKSGAGALTLNGAMTSSAAGEFILDEGRLNIGHAEAVGDGNFVIKSGTTWDATSDLTLSMTAGRAIKFYGGGDFTFAGSHNLNMGTNDVAIQVGNANIDVAANTLTLGGNVEGNNLKKEGAGTMVLNGALTNSALLVEKGTAVLGASGDVKGTMANESGVEPIWVYGNGDAFDATYKVAFDGAQSVSNHDVRSLLAYSGLPAQAFAPDTPTGEITMRWRERTPDEDLLVSNVLDLGGDAVPTTKYLLAMTYDPGLLTGDEATLAGNGSIYVIFKDGGDWVNAGTTFLGDSPIPTTVAEIETALAAMSVGFYGVDSASHTAWAVLDHASEFSVVPEPATLGLLLAGGLLVLKRKRSGS